MTFNPQKFAQQGGTLSEKLAKVFDSIGATHDGSATTGDKGRLMGSGSMAATLANAATTTNVPLQINRTFTLMGADNTGGAAYFKSITGAALGGQLATVMVRTTIAHSLFDAYGVQSHLVFGASADVSTTDANAHLTALSAKVTMDTSTVTKGWVNAGLFIWEGAGTITQMGHVVSLVNEAGSTGAQSMLHINDDVGTVPYFSFAGADGSGKGLYSHAITLGATGAGGIKVLINGVAKWIPYVAAE
ncbi:MAG: hypothetical protein WCX63_07165 [Methanoregula sp.]